MFKRKKKTTNPQSNNLFKMKELYDTSKLVVGNFERISKKLSKRKGYPVKVTSDDKYIFEIIEEDGILRVQEITMGITINLNSTDKFDIPYISNIEPLNGIYDFGTISKIPKLAFDWILKDINEKEKEKEKNKNKELKKVA